MRQVDIHTLRKLQIDILNVVDRYCDESQIKYWLDGGTLLGAIRHKGYIPWDDDIDIGMLRPDFDRFVNEFNGYNERYEVACVETNPTFAYPFAKVMDKHTILYEPDKNGNKIHINIDIFVYDNAPIDSDEINRLFNKRDFYRNANTLRTMHNKPSGNLVRRSIVRLLRVMVRPFPRNYFSLKEIDNAKTYSDKETCRIGNFLGWSTFTCNKRVFDSFIPHEFEGKLYKIPIGYDEYLTECFGNYMELPPVEERVSHHKFVAYIEDEIN